MIHDEIVTFKVAKLAKEKGFDEECGEFYCEDKSQKRITRISCNRHVTSFDYCTNSMLEDYYPPHEYCYIAAPTQSLLQRWLREEKGIVVEVICLPTTRTSSKYEYKRHLFWGSDGHYLEGEYGDEIYDTYELALEDALKYALENLV